MANSRQGDLIGSKVMQKLRVVSGQDNLKFFGYGGQWMKKEGLDSTIDIDMNMFMDKTFVTYRKTKTVRESLYYRWNPLNFVNKHYTKNTDDIHELLMEADLPKKIHQGRPSLILNIDNEYMTFMLMDEIKKYYANSALDMPKRHYFNRFIKDFRQWTQKYVDYMHYTVPLVTGSSDGFYFPGRYIGQYGVYEATKHIYQSDPTLGKLVNENSLFVNKRYFATDMEKAIDNIRHSFRERNGIDQDATVIFFAPGNEANEAEFCCQNMRRGVKEFLLKYSAPTSLSPKAEPMKNFTTVISLHKGSEGEKYVRDFLKENEWTGNVVFVSNEENEHINAMAASDMAAIYDGQMIGSAAACHLPTMNLIKMRMHHQWYNDLFNRYWNDLNIIADKNIYPELIGGEVWYGKIADTLAEWYVKPDVRYNMIKQWDGFLAEAMSYKEIDRSVVRTRDHELEDGQAYSEYEDPFFVAASAMWADIQKYEINEGSHCQNHSSLRVKLPSF
eukprot:CAMPEP_0176366870 /NCGR_PEP_ID=MMETSP0126-20121128/21482_1 /TAXON_ID=141414 ORGANISM="Strombidinopsis acuminatum, Strain SPMC142" /NCGR_SAMPLE_ID=MMETSP0126 /ASSEMBLY_ACC=CAM_ASM_000229 /LENGTH=500 /DNA_ID=CAMNT_0017724463 /DNA_START=72 /DNA_END=1574 /DNA_ORIENTATION=-